MTTAAMPFQIQGATLTGTTSSRAPHLLVISPPKAGKSTTVISLWDWPNKGDRPLVIAADPNGPDVCSKFGYQVPVIRIQDQPGTRFAEKTQATIDAIETGIARGPRPCAIVLDCISTLVERLVTEERRFSKNRDSRSWYIQPTLLVSDLVNRITDFGIPFVSLAWLEEGGIENMILPNGAKTTRQYLGGPNVMGTKMRGGVAGKADMILLLDKTKIGVGQPGADPEGYIRQFRTKTYNQIECGGRYELPDPCPAHLGYCFSQIIGLRQQGAQQ